MDLLIELIGITPKIEDFSCTIKIGGVKNIITHFNQIISIPPKDFIFELKMGKRKIGELRLPPTCGTNWYRIGKYEIGLKTVFSSLETETLERLTKESTSRSKNILTETIDIANGTMDMLNTQTKTIDKIDDGLQEIQLLVKQGKRCVRSINSPFGTLFNKITPLPKSKISKPASEISTSSISVSQKHVSIPNPTCPVEIDKDLDIINDQLDILYCRAKQMGDVISIQNDKLTKISKDTTKFKNDVDNLVISTKNVL